MGILKTYLSPEDQWDRTSKLAIDDYASIDCLPYLGLGLDWYLGQIVLPHHLFAPGDFVVIRNTNGFAERQPVWGVSSKGYVIKGHYLKYQSFSQSGGRVRYVGQYYQFAKMDPLKRKYVWLTQKKRCRRPLREGYFPHGPLRFVEVPEDLVGLQPDALTLRRHIVALAREGWRMPGKRE